METNDDTTLGSSSLVSHSILSKYCTVLGHTKTTSKECYMNGISKKEWDATLKFIMNELVTKELELKKDSKWKHYAV